MGENVTSTSKGAPERIKAKPLPHPWRWFFAIVLLALAVWFIVGALGNEAYGWTTYRSTSSIRGS